MIPRHFKVRIRRHKPSGLWLARLQGYDGAFGLSPGDAYKKLVEQLIYLNYRMRLSHAAMYHIELHKKEMGRVYAGAQLPNWSQS